MHAALERIQEISLFTGNALLREGDKSVELRASSRVHSI
jgi:hypothetical protein